MERVQRWREPAVVVVVLVLLVRLVLGAASVGGASGTTDAAALALRQLSDPTPFVVLGLLVLACHADPVTAHARTLATVGLGVAGAGLLLALGLAVWGHQTGSVPSSGLDLTDRLAATAVSLLAVLLLGLLATRPVSSRRRPAVEAGTGAEADGRPAEARPPAPDPALEPTWASDVAAGAAWTTAGEAATGRPATAWGTPAGTGWEVARPQEEPAQEKEPADQAGQPSGEQEGHPWGRPSP